MSKVRSTRNMQVAETVLDAVDGRTFMDELGRLVTVHVKRIGAQSATAVVAVRTPSRIERMKWAWARKQVKAE